MIYHIFVVLIILIMIDGFIKFAEKSTEDKEKIFFFWSKIFLIIVNATIIYKISFDDYSVVKSWDELGNYFSTSYFAKTIISILTSIGAYFFILRIEIKIGNVIAKKYDKLVQVIEKLSPISFAKTIYKKVLPMPIIIVLMKILGIIKENRGKNELGEKYYLFKTYLTLTKDQKQNIEKTVYDFSVMLFFLFFILLNFFSGWFFIWLFIIGIFIWLFLIVISFGLTAINKYPNNFTKIPDMINIFISKTP